MSLCSRWCEASWPQSSCSFYCCWMAQKREKEESDYSGLRAVEIWEWPRRAGFMHILQILPIFCQFLIKMSTKRLKLLGISISLLLRHAALVKASASDGESLWQTCSPLAAVTETAILVGLIKGSLLSFKVHLAAHSSPTPCSFWQVTLILLTLNFLQSERGYYSTFLPGTVWNGSAYARTEQFLLLLSWENLPGHSSDGIFPTLDPKVSLSLCRGLTELGFCFASKAKYSACAC